MTQKNGGGQAYPAAWGNHEQGGDYIPGMTLRDWFAGQALAGMFSIWANRLSVGDKNETRGQWMARNAYDMADAMLAARDKD